MLEMEAVSVMASLTQVNQYTDNDNKLNRGWKAEI